MKFRLSRKINTLKCKFVFEKFGKSMVNGKIIIRGPKNISIGDYSRINLGCILNAFDGKIIIGDNVHISPYVVISTGGLIIDMDYKNRKHYYENIIIEDGVWIGSGAIINPGVTIGEGSVVGAGAVVTKNIPKKVFAVGVPAEVKRNIQL